MKKKFLTWSINSIQKYQFVSEEDVDKLRYGLEGIYLTFTKMIILLVLAVILGIFKEVCCVLVFFNFIRFTGFGFHAEKSSQCLVLSIMNFIMIPLFFIHAPLSQIVIQIICIACIVSYLLFAPADTKKRPLPNKRKRIIRKLATVGIGLIYCILVFSFPNSFFQPLLLSAMVIQAIAIQPLLYMLFKQPYRNYRWYLNGLNT